MKGVWCANPFTESVIFTKLWLKWYVKYPQAKTVLSEKVSGE